MPNPPESTADVLEWENVTIPLLDGTRLAARIWLPGDAAAHPVPAILEYLPYRKRDGTAVRDELTHPFFARHGYACVRVDMRGCGESTGHLADEYLPQEQADALEVIDWLADRQWCDGNVGMMGISWGGFNALQVAARRPPPLKAIISLCSTDDRYADDVHYKGGVMLAENLAWAATMFNFQAAVPDPLLVDDWRERWLARLDAMPHLAIPWLSHQTRDDYWRHASVCEDYAAIEAATMLVGGWGDAYKNPVGRLMEHLHCPRRALLGPWIHKYPHFAVPEPRIGFLQEALAWWDRWLKGRHESESPVVSCYVMDAVPPAPQYRERPGRWVATEGWPSSHVTPELLVAGDDARLTTAGDGLTRPVAVRTPLTAGVGQGEYCAIWFGPDLPDEQTGDDAVAATWDCDPLTAPLDVLGQPVARLRIASTTDVGHVTVRLNDVRPDGTVALVTYGIANLRLVGDPEHVTPLVPGEPIDVTVPLDLVGYRMPAGHRLRLSVSSANFPLVWSPPRRSDLVVHAASLEVPRLTGSAGTPVFPDPQTAAGCRLEGHRDPHPRRRVIRDVATGEVSVIVDDDLGDHTFLDHGLRVDQSCREVYTAHPDDATRHRADITWHYHASRPGQFAAEVTSVSRLSCDETTFYLSAEQTAVLDGVTVGHRTWSEAIPRVAS